MLVEVDDVRRVAGGSVDVGGLLENGSGVHKVVVWAWSPARAGEVILVDDEDETTSTCDGLEGVNKGEDGLGVTIVGPCHGLERFVAVDGGK